MKVLERRFRYKVGDRFRFVIFSDVHLGSRLCSISNFKENLIDGKDDNAQDVNRIFDDDAVVTVTYTQLVGPEGPSIPAPGKMRVTNFRGTFR